MRALRVLLEEPKVPVVDPVLAALNHVEMLVGREGALRLGS